MEMAVTAGYVFASLALIVVVFQALLALGAPWGESTWGGQFPGKLPTGMRVVAVFSGLIMLLFALVVLSKAGVAVLSLARAWRGGIWVVASYSALGSIANSLRPGRGERLLWLPVTIAILITSLIVALC